MRDIEIYIRVLNIRNDDLSKSVADALGWDKNVPIPSFTTDIDAMFKLFRVLCNYYIVMMSNGDGDIASVELTPFNGMTHSSGSWDIGNTQRLPECLCRAFLYAEFAWDKRPAEDKWTRNSDHVPAYVFQFDLL